MLLRQHIDDVEKEGKNSFCLVDKVTKRSKSKPDYYLAIKVI